MASESSSKKRIGLLAAWGRFPIVVAEALKRDGHEVYCLGVKRHCDPAIRELVDDFEWLGAARLGGAIRYFNRHGVTQATMAGKFHKAEIYRPWAWFRYTPDAVFLRAFYKHFVTSRADRKDDTLLGVLVDTFAQGGVEFLPATDFAPELLVGEGLIAGREPSVSERADIEFGWRLAKEMGRLDVGQSVCVKDRAPLAVEAIEGTDVCIQRAGQLCPRGGFTVVKVAKPRQDMRFDVPTIGVRTLRTMAAAGGRLLAVEAGRTILLDEPDVCSTADRLGVTVVALQGAEEDAPRSTAA
ncbi:LpxI family protein [Pseudobythopirellula maris]|uniref:LpxI family protein n=1 Tax=Pseudobythopirellula maris TaxID=2527991 RepID=UPI001E47EB63|nr:UDP-2,3-diacylglucosamine diphosphatase LpxI [Pseudobythopirellula maris]